MPFGNAGIRMTLTECGFADKRSRDVSKVGYFFAILASLKLSLYTRVT